MRSPLVAVALAGLVLSGCSGDPAPPDPAPPTPTQSAAPLWNPCTSLDTDAVSARLGGTYTVRRGTPEAPTCVFAPVTDGDPAVEVSYQTFPGSLEELVRTFGVTEDGTRVTTPRVRGVADARVVVDVSDDDTTLFVTGFVRNGVLVQLVNAVDPQPYDRAALVADVESLMADLAAGAKASGLTG